MGEKKKNPRSCLLIQETAKALKGKRMQYTKKKVPNVTEYTTEKKENFKMELNSGQKDGGECNSVSTRKYEQGFNDSTKDHWSLKTSDC